MIDGYATLHELQNAPAGTVFRERRYVAEAPITVLGVEYGPGTAEYRSTFRALPPGPKRDLDWYARRIEELAQGAWD